MHFQEKENRTTQLSMGIGVGVGTISAPFCCPKLLDYLYISNGIRYPWKNCNETNKSASQTKVLQNFWDTLYKGHFVATRDLCKGAPLARYNVEQAWIFIG